MAAKGTGYDAYRDAIKNAADLKKKHDECIIHKVDTGLCSSLDHRMLRATLMREGVDIDDTRDKFTVAHEAHQSR